MRLPAKPGSPPAKWHGKAAPSQLDRALKEPVGTSGRPGELGLRLVRRLRGTPAPQVVNHAEGETNGLQGAHHEFEVLLQRSLLGECLGVRYEPRMCDDRLSAVVTWQLPRTLRGPA